MVEDLKNVTSDLIKNYVDYLVNNGDPYEAYKYVAFNTFQQNWDIDAIDFYQMFRNSFSKAANLVYQNSMGFINLLAQSFPNDVRNMFRDLYDESLDISHRIKSFQAASDKMLPNLKVALNRSNLNAQQDERTISVYLAFRFPEKYILYKADYYIYLCEKLNIKQHKPGERLLHFQELANQMIQDGLLNDVTFINTYRKFYKQPVWDDRYLMIQNVLFVTFRNNNQMKSFEDFVQQFGEYINEKSTKYRLGRNEENWVWILDKDELINYEYVHYELYFSKNKISIDLHFEFNKKIASEFNSLFNELPENLEWMEWQQGVPSITHKKKVDINDDGRFVRTLKALDELFDFTYPKLKTKVESMNTPKKIPLNQILFGAPGTGKTYNTKEKAVEIINGFKFRTREIIISEFDELLNAGQIVFTTFHQSLSYEEFIEGIKPEIVDGNVTYEVKDGIFKRLCQNANPENTVDFENAYKKLQQKLSENDFLELQTPTKKSFAISLNRNGNLSLMTGTKREKQGVLTKDKIFKLLNNEKIYDGWDGYFNGVINYLKSEFGFKSVESKNIKRYVLIIDEINRGNVSSIFGELITLLEEDKRKGNVEQIEVTLPYSGETFSVPNNVYIIGTMNTADRSVEALDTALRRRFSFVEMQPDLSILEDKNLDGVELQKLLVAINQRIEVLIDKDHQIGHSYFLGLENLSDLKQTFKDKIIPLLEEYFYGNYGKIGLVLGEKFITQLHSKVSFPCGFEEDAAFLDDKKVYRFTSDDYWDSAAFISVYQNSSNEK